MTTEQIEQFNRMRNALIKISEQYQTPEEMRVDSEDDYGLEFEEAIEMAYENIQSDAAQAVKGIKAIESPSLSIGGEEK